MKARAALRVVREIRGRFSIGVVFPLEELDLTKGSEVVIAVKDDPPLERKRKALRASAGAWKRLHHPDELIRNTYASRLIQRRASHTQGLNRP